MDQIIRNKCPVLARMRGGSRIARQWLLNSRAHGPSYVNIIENGRQNPGFVLAKRIADFFGVTVDELFFCEPKDQSVQKNAADCMYGRCCYAARFGSCE